MLFWKIMRLAYLVRVNEWMNINKETCFCLESFHASIIMIQCGDRLAFWRFHIQVIISDSITYLSFSGLHLSKQYKWNLNFKSFWKCHISSCYYCLVTKLCPSFCDPMDCSSPGSSVHGISQARVAEWIAISFSRGTFPTQGSNHVACLSGGFFSTEPPGKPLSNSIHVFESIILMGK